jgi:O-acetyl-ADP-ribose deacetylase (regulator of RNase III)
VSTENHRTTFLNGRIEIIVADITKLSVDVIVNAANSTLLGGGGVDGAIHRAGGSEILRECEEIRRAIYPGGLPAGEAVMTTAGKLTAKKVIHTVGPIYGRHAGKEAQLLANCYTNSLNLAATGQLKTVAFPAISTGVYGYPKREAALVVSNTLKTYFLDESEIGKVWLVFFSESDAAKFLKHQEF